MASYLVVGLGRFGRSVARTLYQNNQEVLAIDSDEDLVQKAIDEQIVGEAITFDATDENSLLKVVKDNFDTAVVAIGTNLQASIMVTLLLKEMGIKNIICKATTKMQGKVLEKIGATSVIYPEEEIGERLAMEILRENIKEHFKFSNDYRMFEFEIPESFVGKNLIELGLRQRYEMNVVGLKNKESGDEMINPTPLRNLKKGDVLFVVTKVENINEFNKVLVKKEG